MKTKLAIIFLLLALLPVAPVTNGLAGDDFNTVVKAIEQFYHVKHENIPFLARAGMKAARTAAKIKGGEAKRIAEAGSVRVAFFENQDFNSRGQIVSFKTAVQGALNQNWSALIQTLAPKEELQTYIYVRDAGEKFHVMVITIERRDATVVQATLTPKAMAMLMRDPDEMGKTITEDATIIDN